MPSVRRPLGNTHLGLETWPVAPCTHACDHRPSWSCSKQASVRCSPSSCFPPKDEEQARQLWRTVRELESLGPDFVSVTYGASGSTRERTITATEAIAQNTTLRTMAHLTCASQSRDQLRTVVGSYAASGIRHVLAIRGDMPGGPTVPWVRHDHGLANATELVAMVAELGDFCIGVAAFPDLHPERHDGDLDARVLVEKAKAGAGFAITQLFFTADRYFQLVDRVRSLGCDLPIIPGHHAGDPTEPDPALRRVVRRRTAGASWSTA